MKQLLLAICALVFWAGCGAGAPPATLSVEEIPAELEKAFKTAKEEQRMLIAALSRQIENKKFAPVTFQLQGMLEDRSLSKEQSAMVARALVTLNALVQKQIEVQEAATAPLPGPGGSSQPPPQLPKDVPADAEGAEQAKMMREIYRRTK